jgi:murein L,D-transpeptidase YcbB/YkuD
VRLEDYKRLAKFVFDGAVPQGKNPKVEEHINLPREMPVYMTYLTVQPTADGVQFLQDHYGRDAHLLDRYGPQLMAAVHGN